MKQRFSSLDVKVITHELSKTLVSLRVSNIYDLSTRIFLFKFAKPNQREQLLIDSGFRCHLTSFARSSAAAPSPFVSRLRKFLRTRRCTKVQQIGTDRVVELQFSDGAYRLFLEFYAGGNIVLTDAELNILGLLRSVNEGAEHEQYRAGLKYNVSLRQNYDGVPELTKERIRDGLQRSLQAKQLEALKPGKKIKKKGGDQLRKALAVTTHEFPPVLLDHALHVTQYDRDLQPEQVVGSEELLDKLMISLQEAKRLVEEMMSQDIARGYIIAKQITPGHIKSGETRPAEEAGDSLLYEDFHPFKPAHLAGESGVVVIEHEGFNKTADIFFSSLEGQKLESRLQEREDNARQRIEHAREEQAKRVGGLQQVQELNVRKAQAIEANVERVNEAVAAVNGLIAQGMDWVDIGKLIENEQARGNEVARSIKLPLKLHENTITLLLSESSAELEEDAFVDETDSEASDSEGDTASQPTTVKGPDQRLPIDIDLASSPWSNATQYYDQKRSAAEKQERTAQASQKALKSTEQKVMTDLKKGLKQEKEILRPVRKQMWFEKFTYFISSDGYLVLAGRDAQQNEILYRRHLRKGDVYVHADVNGAASVIVKNNIASLDAPIPPSTLGQAGQLAVCTSSAWDSKAVMAAWWVNADQVSKTAPTGEFLTVGGFMIRGTKNFLPPAQLLLGFAVVFEVSEESKVRHAKHRLEPLNNADGHVSANGTVPASVAARDLGSDSDDEFPDAAPGQFDQKADEEDDVDDDFPDAVNKDNDPADDDAEDDHGTASAADHSTSRYNPLRGNEHANKSGGYTHAGDDQESLSDDGAAPGGDSASVDDVDDGAAGAEGADATTNPSTNPPHHEEGTGQKDDLKSSVKHNSKQQSRGKRSKAKRAAAKYADQDTEDRELAMKILGSRAAEEKQQALAAEQVSKAESLEAARARRRAQHEKRQKEGLEAEELRRLNLKEGVDDLDEDENSALSQLDAFVGTPLPGDEILEAIPICAPWSALARYKYKIKIQPGQQKKGKAVREILTQWTKHASDSKKLDQSSQDTEKMWPREADLIKGWKEAEILGVVPVKSVRVVVSGGGSQKGAGGKGGRGGRGGKGSKKK